MRYDVLIIGSGPAALTAAVYVARANLNTVFIEKDVPGGKLSYTSRIENWTGDISLLGHELAKKMFDHAKHTGAKYQYGEVIEILTGNKMHSVLLKNNIKIETKFIIIATGTVEKIPHEIKNIISFNNRGVSYCAICDGPLYKNKLVGVIGGGNSAIEESLYLSSIAKEVFIFVKDKITAEKKTLIELKKKKNVQIFLNSQIKEILGKEKVEFIKVEINKEEKKIKLEALFPYIGLEANSKFLQKLKITDQKGFIKVNENMETSIKRIYAVGDVTVKNIRQIATAASDGVIAAKNIIDNI